MPSFAYARRARAVARGWHKYDDYDPGPFGQAIRECRLALQSADPVWTQAYLARVSEIGHNDKDGNRGTISKVEAGKSRLSPERRGHLLEVLRKALEVSSLEISRRDFLLSLLASFTLDLGPLGPAQRQHRSSHQTFDPDAYDSLIPAWGKLLYAGYGPYVIEDAQFHYEKLANDPRINSDDFLTLRALRVARMLGRAQEIFSASDEWNARAVTTYDTVEAHVCLPALDRWPTDPSILYEYAAILASRGIQYRKRGRYQQGVLNATRALKYAKQSENTQFAVDIYLQLAHIWACLGIEQQWRKVIDNARKYIEASNSVHQAELNAYCTYYEGEGLKRLAYTTLHDLSLKERSAFASHGLSLLANSKEQLGRCMDWVITDMHGYHPLYTQVAEAQCMLFLAPNETRKQLDYLREEILHDYPGLLGRVDFAMKCVDVLHGWNHHNPLPAFDIDTLIIGESPDARHTDAAQVRAQFGY